MKSTEIAQFQKQKTAADNDENKTILKIKFKKFINFKKIINFIKIHKFDKTHKIS